MTNERLRKTLEKWGLPKLYPFNQKRDVVSDHLIQMINRTSNIFHWTGLPESIPSRVLEHYLQLNGNACFYSHNSTLYVFCGSRGGEPDVYYEPTLYTIANPALNLSLQLRIGTECVVMPNDSMYSGLYPIFLRYATLQCETELSLQMAIIMSRMPSIITADTDNDVKAGQKYIDDIINGKLSIYPKANILQSVNTHPIATASARTITDLIEVEQYVKSAWYNDIGLNANYNMKRESINSVEAQLNDHAIFSLVSDMLECRKEYASQVNSMFGTNISVTYSDLWQSEYNASTGKSDKTDKPDNPDTDSTDTPNDPEDGDDRE